MNLLLITLDQFRGDCLSAAGHRVVRTPNLDRLAVLGVRFDRHYSQAAPCSPGRACLYTGTYQMNNRVVANGTPLDDRLDNLARAARRAGFDPTLFGYTDQGVDPRAVQSPDDPRFPATKACCQASLSGWISQVSTQTGSNGSEASAMTCPHDAYAALATEPNRPEEVGVSAFLTDRYLDWLERAPLVRPPQLLEAPPSLCRRRPVGCCLRSRRSRHAHLPSPKRHRLHEAALRLPQAAAPADEGSLRRMRAQYYGMIGDVDAQIGRVHDALERLGQWEDTVVLLTSDHGEQLGDHGLKDKLGYFEESYRVPAIVRAPSLPGTHGTVVRTVTETSTSSPPSARPSVWRSPLSATGWRSRHSSKEALRNGGAPRQPGVSTGDTWAFPVAPSIGLGTGTWNGTISPCGASTTLPTSSSATAHGAATTSPPIRPGAQKSKTPHGSLLVTVDARLAGGACGP